MARNGHAIGPPAARIRRTTPRAGRPALAALFALALVIAALVGAGPASAATQSTVATNVTAPNGGVMLTGANGSKHLWVPDHLNGVCRVDAAGLNQNTCALFLGTNAVKPGQLSFDPVNNYLYIPDLSAKSQGSSGSSTTRTATTATARCRSSIARRSRRTAAWAATCPGPPRSARTATSTCRSRSRPRSCGSRIPPA